MNFGRTLQLVGLKPEKMRTVVVGQDIEHFGSLDSTNSEMLRRLRDEEVPEGKLIQADEQTEGRGQRGASWESSSGSDLTFSVLFYPEQVAPDEQYDISRAVTLGIADAILYLDPTCGERLKIKWPNDILIGGRKLAGILIENSVQGGRIAHSVVGIGFNLHRTEREERMGHSSLESGLGMKLGGEEMLERLCKGLERRYFQLKRGDLKGLRSSFNERCHLLGEWGTFEDSNGEFRARVREVDPSGNLILEGVNGDERSYAVKEVRFIA